MKNNKAFGKYFARAVHTDMVDLDDISDIIERNCTLKRSDVKACLTELVEVMRDKMQSSNKVRINGLGIFKINVKSTGVSDPSEFKGNNITGYRVLFTPEHSVVKANGSYVDGGISGQEGVLALVVVPPFDLFKHVELIRPIVFIISSQISSETKPEISPPCRAISRTMVELRNRYFCPVIRKTVSSSGFNFLFASAI